MKAYRTICDKCAVERGLCAKCAKVPFGGEQAEEKDTPVAGEEDKGNLEEEDEEEKGNLEEEKDS